MKTLTECLYETIHKNKKPLKLIAEEVGVSDSYLTRAALPDQEDSETGTGCRFPLKKLIPLIWSTNDFSTLDFIEQSVGRVAIKLPLRAKASTADVCRLTMQSMKEFGKLIGNVEEATEDGKVTTVENEKIQAEGYKAIQAILSLMAACKGKS